MMASQKTKVVQYLYEKLRGEGRSVASFEDVANAIRHCNQHFALSLSDNNPANFMKDLLRGLNASKNWPDSLKAKRITGRQVTGDGRIFEFVPYDEGQNDPFPNPFEPTGEENEVVVESLSLSLVTKSLGRNDESWLIQVAVWLRILENHLARSNDHVLLELSHLQNGIKLSNSEIDALFLAIEEGPEGRHENVLLTCEAKQAKDPILGDQIVRQVRSAFKSVRHLDLNISKIIPLAIKAVGGKGAVYVAEFESWSAAEAEVSEVDQKELLLARRALYRLVPPVPGIGFSQTRKRGNLKPKL
jgi:hypothetical protein